MALFLFGGVSLVFSVKGGMYCCLFTLVCYFLYTSRWGQFSPLFNNFNFELETQFFFWHHRNEVLVFPGFQIVLYSSWPDSLRFVSRESRIKIQDSRLEIPDSRFKIHNRWLTSPDGAVKPVTHATMTSSIECYFSTFPAMCLCNIKRNLGFVLFRS